MAPNANANTETAAIVAIELEDNNITPYYTLARAYRVKRACNCQLLPQDIEIFIVTKNKHQLNFVYL